MRYLAMVVLIVMAIPSAYADNYKGTMTRRGTKMEYSFSGGTVTDKVVKGQGTTDMIVFVEGTVEPGSTVSGTFKKLMDYGKLPQNVSVEIYANTTDGKIKELQQKKGADAATASAKVPSDAKKVNVNMNFTGRTGRFSCIITWKVEKKTSAPKTQTTTSNSKLFSTKGEDGRLSFSLSGGENPRNNHINMNIHPGNTINLSCSAGKNYQALIQVLVNHKIVKKAEGKSPSLSYTIPADMKKGEVSVKIFSKYKDQSWQTYTSKYIWYIVKDPNATESKQEAKPSTNKSFKWDDVAADDRCPHCNGQFSYYFRGYNKQGTVVAYCNSNPKNSKREIVGDFDAIYYNDYIETDSESELLLDYCGENGVLFIMEKSKVHLVKRLSNGRDRWDVYKGRIVGKNLKHANGEPEFHMSQCTATPTGTTYVLEDDGKTSRVMLLEGSMEVVSNKTSKRQTLKPGQVASVNASGQTTVENFDVGATAKKFGISLSKVPTTTSNTKTNTNSGTKTSTGTGSGTNTKTNTGTKTSTGTSSGTNTKSNSGTTTKSSTTTSSASKGKYARYGVKCGIVKFVDVSDDMRLYYTVWFDDYGRLERSEITRTEEKKGNKWVTVEGPKMIDIYVDDKHYMYHKSIGWKQMKNNMTNYLGSGAKTVSGYKIEKSGTATVNGKQCDVFKGKKSSSTVEYYIWQGIVMKRVETFSDGPTSTIVESIELPASVDASKFSLPKGVTVK